MAGGIACIMIGVILFSPAVEVRAIRIERQDARLDVDAARMALAPLFGKRLLFLPVHDVDTLIRHSVPDTDTVTIRKHFPSLLIVHITERPIVARLTFTQPPSAAPIAASGSGTQKTGSGVAPPRAVAAPPAGIVDALTDNGLYMTVPAGGSGTQLPTVMVTDFTAHPTPGTRLTSEDLLLRMQQAEKTLTAQFGYHITNRTLYLRAREFHLATSRMSLWFDMTSPLDEQFQRYRTFLQAVGVNGVVSYVDLRLAGQVVYK